jgi:hypothetical protein
MRATPAGDAGFVLNASMARCASWVFAGFAWPSAGIGTKDEKKMTARTSDRMWKLLFIGKIPRDSEYLIQRAWRFAETFPFF